MRMEITHRRRLAFRRTLGFAFRTQIWVGQEAVEEVLGADADTGTARGTRWQVRGSSRPPSGEVTGGRMAAPEMGGDTPTGWKKICHR